MKIYNKINVLVCVIAILLLAQTSCKNLLDQEPQGQWTTKDKKEGSLQASIFAIYGSMRGFHLTTGNTALAIHCFRSEDAEKGSTPSDGGSHGKMFDDFEYTADNGMLASYWSSNYGLIHSVNNFIYDYKEYEKENTPTEGDLINWSEAHFFRAFCYFNLVRAFGEVPLIDFKLNDAMDANVPKSSTDKIYALIDADLTEATKYLPIKWENRYIGRLTSGAALSLHAKAYLTRNDWGNTYAKAIQVINSGVYDLTTTFDKIFREEGENCSESIFELQCTASDEKPSDGSIGSSFANVQGVRGAGNWNLGWGWHTPTQILADAFEEGDPRKDETLLYFYKTGGDPSSIPANKPWGEKPISNGDVSNAYYNKKAYTSPILRARWNKSGTWFNIRMIRYSDVVLMAAEAACEIGGTQNIEKALEFLEQVRARARGKSTTILPKVTTTDQSELIDAIRYERRIELAMEWDRFYDLVRWDIAKNVLHAAGKINYQNKHALLPLPQSEIDKSNGVLIQNPEY